MEFKIKSTHKIMITYKIFSAFVYWNLTLSFIDNNFGVDFVTIIYLYENNIPRNNKVVSIICFSYHLPIVDLFTKSITLQQCTERNFGVRIIEL